MRSYSCCDSSSQNSKEIQSLSSLLKLVGEETRLRLLCILKDGGEHCVCELIEHADDLSQSLVSHHLRDLKDAGIVESKKIGLKAYYSLTDDGKRIVTTIFTLTNEESQTEESQSKSCCGVNAVPESASEEVSTDKNAAIQKNVAKIVKKGEGDENRSCRNGLCNVSAATQNNSACC